MSTEQKQEQEQKTPHSHVHFYAAVVFLILYVIGTIREEPNVSVFAFIPTMIFLVLAKPIMLLANWLIGEKKYKKRDTFAQIEVRFWHCENPAAIFAKPVSVIFKNTGIVTVSRGWLFSFPKHFKMKEITFEIIPTASRFKAERTKDMHGLSDIVIVTNSGEIVLLASTSNPQNHCIRIIGALKAAHAEALQVLDGHI